MLKLSAGLIMYRVRGKQPEVLLVHPGGPFWAKKDLGAWSIPKGEVEDDGEPLGRPDPRHGRRRSVTTGPMTR